MENATPRAPSACGPAQADRAACRRRCPPMLCTPPGSRITNRLPEAMGMRRPRPQIRCRPAPPRRQDPLGRGLDPGRETHRMPQCRRPLRRPDLVSTYRPLHRVPLDARPNSLRPTMKPARGPVRLPAASTVGTAQPRLVQKIPPARSNTCLPQAPGVPQGGQSPCPEYPPLRPPSGAAPASHRAGIAGFHGMPPRPAHGRTA